MRIEKVVLNKEREDVYLEAYIADKLDKLSSDERTKIYDVIDTMIKHSSN